MKSFTTRMAYRYSFLLILVLLLGCDVEEIQEKESIRVAEEQKTDSINSLLNSRSGSADGDNLLVNGGLEEWFDVMNTYDMPEGWFCHNNTNVSKDWKKVYEGKYSAKMDSKESGSTARIDQRISVYPGQKIRIRFHYYVEKWKSKGARTYCYFRTDAAEKYNISSNELEDFYGKPTYYIIRGGGYNLTYLPHDLNVWISFDETIEVPPTAYYFVFGVNSYYGTTIYIDDCWVIDVTDEPVSTGIKPVTM